MTSDEVIRPANEVVMPRLGWTMEAGRVVEWLKEDGAAVAAGEAIFSVESDKAVTEVEALDSGVLRIPPDSPEPGIEVPVGARLAYIVAPGQPAPFEGGGGGEGAELLVAAGSIGVDREASRTTVTPSGRGGRPAISPRARRTADALGVDWTVLSGSGTTGRIVERDVRLAAGPTVGLRPRATPVTRRLAEEHGVNLELLATDAPRGRVTRAAVRAATPGGEEERAGRGDGVAMSQIRRVIARRMTENARSVAPVTLTTEADATELSRVRGHLKDELTPGGEVVPSLSDLVVRLVALALVEHPALNASLVEDRIVEHAAVHIGIAVDTERGLLVPVVRDAEGRSVREIATEAARLIEAARTGTSRPEELTGGTFTVTNLGMYGIDAFTPIVTVPECAVLGLGRIVARPVVVDEATEAVAVRKMMALSLTFDHRLVDGAPAARFLQRVVGMVERPYSWLMR